MPAPDAKAAPAARFKPARILLDNCISLLRGRIYCGKKYLDGGRQAPRFALSDFESRIVRREELGGANSGRLDNMELAAARLDGLVIGPGRCFSLRKILGDPTAANGYREGPILINGRLRSSPGGGLCQVSSALFNAALLAGMEILEKHNHSRDLWGEKRFIGLGLDAVYVYACKDLKFRNPLEEWAAIKMKLDREGPALRCGILSPSAPRSGIRVSVKVLREMAIEGMPESEYRKGWEVLTERRETSSDGTERTTYSGTSFYRPFVLKDNGMDGE